MAVGFLLFARGRRRWLGAVWLAISALALMATLSKIALLAIVVLGAAAIATQRRWRWPLVAAFFVAGIVVSQLPLVKERWSTAVYGLFLHGDQARFAQKEMSRKGRTWLTTPAWYR